MQTLRSCVSLTEGIKPRDAMAFVIGSQALVSRRPFTPGDGAYNSGELFYQVLESRRQWGIMIKKLGLVSARPGPESQIDGLLQLSLLN